MNIKALIEEMGNKTARDCGINSLRKIGKYAVELAVINYTVMLLAAKVTGKKWDLR